MKVMKKMLTVLAVVVLVAVSMPLAGSAQNTAARKRQDKATAADQECTDKTSKITREQWIEIMAAEFDRLDKNKSGAIEVVVDPANESEQSKSSFPSFSSYGK